ncbi:unnamed protein product [Urochloa decumbens]|uniref:Uncharacterized protein n=1 Tax=Urochloa decumbens TaxID=240449 RepID=A0ABC9B3E3_9POAL
MHAAQEDLQVPAEPVAQPFGMDEWPAWPEQQEDNNDVEVVAEIVPQHPDQPQDTISFDQSGSTACYLRAHGPDITLRVEDVLQGKYASSSSDSDNLGPEVQSTLPCAGFLVVEENAFNLLTYGSIQQPVLSNPVLERVDISRVPTFCIDKSIFQSAAAVTDDSMAIIPYNPTLAAVLIRIWASAQPTFSESDQQDTLLSDSAAASSEAVDMEGDDIATLSLPTKISENNPHAVLEESFVRRSTRLSQNKDGYKHIQLEDHPRKKRKVWTEVPLTGKEAMKLLDKALVAGDDIPSQIPNDMLRAWGIECNVAPEELTDEALSQSANISVPNDNTAE